MINCTRIIWRRFGQRRILEIFMRSRKTNDARGQQPILARVDTLHFCEGHEATFLNVLFLFCRTVKRGLEYLRPESSVERGFIHKINFYQHQRTVYEKKKM